MACAQRAPAPFKAAPVSRTALRVMANRKVQKKVRLVLVRPHLNRSWGAEPCAATSVVRRDCGLWRRELEQVQPWTGCGQSSY